MSFMKKSETKEFKHVNIDLDVHYRISDLDNDRYTFSYSDTLPFPPWNLDIVVLFCFVSHRIILKVKKKKQERKKFRVN